MTEHEPEHLIITRGASGWSASNPAGVWRFTAPLPSTAITKAYEYAHKILGWNHTRLIHVSEDECRLERLTK